MIRLSAALSLAVLAGCATTPLARLDIHDQLIDTVRAKAFNSDEEAVHDLCYRYIYGRHAEKNYAEALSWCTKGAELGVDSSQTLLAEMYYFGKGVPVDYSAAHRWYLAAAAQGHEHAMLMLYHIYKDGTGVAPDQALANLALKMAVDANYGPALEEQAEIDAN